MRKTRFAILLGLFAWISLQIAVLGRVIAAPISMVALTREMLSRVDGLLAETKPARQKNAMNALLARRFDFDAFEAKVLKDVAPSFSPEQHRRFSKAFRGLFRDYVFTKLKGVPADVTLASCRVTQGETNNVVSVLGTFKQSQYDVVLYWSTASAPRVVDISVSDALLSRNYRAMINKTLREHGFEGLLDKLKEKQAGLEHSSVAK